jgi:hypothetical protein
MKTAHVIFSLELKPEDLDADQADQREFPQDWDLLGSGGKDYQTATLFKDETHALTYLKGTMKSGYAYRVCKWTIKENVKIFSNCPQLVEVDEL